MATKEQVRLQTEPRTALGHHARVLRREGKVPARIYGHGDSVPVQIDERTFTRLRETHQTSGVIYLALGEGKAPETVLVRHIEHEPRSGKILHIDFFRVRMNELIRGRVPLRLVGESPAAKLNGGSVIALLEALEIESLPDDIPTAADVDVTKLINADDVIHAGDINLPSGVTLVTDASEPIAKVQMLRGAEATPVPAPTPTEEQAAS
ncbi:MAG: 50S ribosomal protein L25 [Ktedonobacterales bacterium]|nr:50S ribosomal protein L25 [Ktedonobacterales bacterium]